MRLTPDPFSASRDTRGLIDEIQGEAWTSPLLVEMVIILEAAATVRRRSRHPRRIRRTPEEHVRSPNSIAMKWVSWWRGWWRSRFGAETTSLTVGIYRRSPSHAHF
jgi:hypothetical protein